MNGGGVFLSPSKDFARDGRPDRPPGEGRGPQAEVVAGQLEALEKYDRANVARILLEHVARVAGR